ncbi:MAG: glycosyltransferase [Planctomycetota bacterium]
MKFVAGSTPDANGPILNRSSDSNATSSMRILVLSATFPASAEPGRGVFVKERAKALKNYADFDIRVVAPVPWAPPIKRFSNWYRLSQYARSEILDGLPVTRPRYFLPPKIGGYFHPSCMYRSVAKCVDRIRTEFEFDLIDAHFVFPSGVVAAKLGRRYGVPVAMTGRGEDMLRFPSNVIMRKSIEWALNNADCCIGVSREIATAMRNNGAAESKIQVVPNGIEFEKFNVLDKEECRERLNLPSEKKIILGVGDRLELKGFHLLVDAMPEVLKIHPNAHLIIVGGKGRFGRDYTSEIERRIAEHHLENQVSLAGPKPHKELVEWYNAADLFALMSSREGSPNVLIEALACGLPAIGTPVGGIPDELNVPLRGRVLSERSVSAASQAICDCLSKTWDRQAIHESMRGRNWCTTATRLAEMLQDVSKIGLKK